MTVAERQLDDVLGLGRQVGLLGDHVLEVFEGLFGLLELAEQALQLLLHGLVALLEPGHHGRGVLVLTGGEVDLRLEDVSLGVEAVGEVGRLDGVDVAQSARVVARHEVGPRLLEEAVEPVLGAGVDAVPELDRRRQLLLVDGRVVVVVEAHRGRVVGARHGQVGEVAHALLVLDALGPVFDRLHDALEGLHSGDGFLQLHVADAVEELRLDVKLRLLVDLLEELDGLFVLAVAVLVPTQQVVELPEEVALVVVVEAPDLLLRVLADALDDVGGLGELGRQLGQPEQGLVELEVVGLVGDLAEDRVGVLEELQAVERDGQVVLGNLLVARVIARLAAVDAVERQGRLGPLFGLEQLVGRRGLVGGGTGHHGPGVFDLFLGVGVVGVEVNLGRLARPCLAGVGLASISLAGVALACTSLASAGLACAGLTAVLRPCLGDGRGRHREQGDQKERTSQPVQRHRPHSLSTISGVRPTQPSEATDARRATVQASHGSKPRHIITANTASRRTIS